MQDIPGTPSKREQPGSKPHGLSSFAPILAVLLFVLLSRLLTAERVISGLDPGNYMLGMRDYSIANERPHPPGYPVYIALCRIGAVLTGGDHSGILAVLILSSVVAVLFLYLLSTRWLDRRSGIVAAVLLASNPLFWLYGSVTENYAWDAVVGTGLILMFLSVKGRWWVLAGLAVGLAFGVRGTSLLLMAPAVLAVLWFRWKRHDLSLRDWILSLVGGVAGIAAWLPAVVVNEGGIAMYLRASTNLTTASAGTFIGNIAGFVITLAWTLNIGGLYLLWRGPGELTRTLRTWRSVGPHRIVLSLWIVPPTLFFLFIIYAKGYILLILPALCLAIVALLRREPSRRLRVYLPVALIAVNAGIFLFAPYVVPPPYTTLAPRNRSVEQRASSVIGRALSVFVPSLDRIRTDDRQVTSAIEMIERAVGSGPDTTLVVLDPASRQFVNSRVLQVYLPTMYFAEPGVRNDRMVTYFHGIDKEERFGPDAAFSAKRLLLLTHPGLLGRYEGLGERVVDRNEFYALLQVPLSRRDDLRNRLDTLFIRWDMEGDPRARTRDNSQ